ncbi:hypothetical protein WDU99_01790 [Microbacterium sp. Mu-80]|uniref:Terminase n=1 Tax=Microbacterium bandirmense TaxID=3122050 RepID=A0ABU8L6U2_9MICO
MATTKPDLIPLFHTPRNPNRETRARRKLNVAKALGAPYIPWQRALAEVWGEIDPKTGGYWYRTLVLIGLRQIGKTTFVRADLAETCLFTESALVRYTAQNQKMGLQRLEFDFYQPIRDSALNPLLDHRVGSAKRGTPGWSARSGSEHIRFVTKSRWETDAVKADSGHGPPLDKGAIDEAFAHEDARVEQAMRPALQTKKGQLLVASAAGDESSLYLAQKRESEHARFRSLTEQYGYLGPTRSRTMFVEFAAPRDADRADPLTWWTYHPGLNGGLIDEEDVQAALEGFEAEPENFDRAYLGWWPQAKRREWIIPQQSWIDTQELDADAIDWTGSPVYGIDVSPDRALASIALAGLTPGARAWLEVARQSGGTAWILDAMLALREAFGGRLVMLDGAGPAASLQADLEKAGFEVVLLSMREVNAACGGLYDDVVQTNIRHGGDTELLDAAKSAVWVNSGDSRRFGRGKSLDDITALYAAALARHGLVTRAPAEYDPTESVIGSQIESEEDR